MISELLRQIQPFIQDTKVDQYDPSTNWSVLEYSEQEQLRRLVEQQSDLDLSVRLILERARLRGRPSRVAFIKFLIVNRFTGREHL